jgi:UDP-4-amino-4,6-dideoxy-N-acetyl-beta-L-altrosamine N-acetyltransferase
MRRIAAADVSFAPLLEQDATVLERIRQMRNAPAVREHMYTDHEISPAEHFQWIQSLYDDGSRQVWVVLYRGQVEGLVSLTEIRPSHGSASWAFYLRPDSQGYGIGGVVEFKLLDLTFGELHLEKLNCEVLATNPKVVDMHKKFGFVVEGVRRANVVKQSRRVDVVLLGIQAHEWRECRPRFARLYTAEDPA